MSEHSNVLVLHSGHRNDVVYVAGLEHAFAQFGCKVIGVSVHDHAATETAVHAVLQEPDEFLCMVSVSYYGVRLMIGDKPLQQCTDVPLVMWLLDNPALFRNPAKDVLNIDPENVVLGANDTAHIDYWHRYICADTPSLEINMGVGQHPSLLPREQDLDAFLARDKSAVLPVNFTHFGMNLEHNGQQISRLSPVAAKVIWDAIDIAARDLAMAPFRAVEMAARTRSIELDGENMPVLTLLTDSYVKLWRRQFVLEQLLDLPVRFLGDGFPEFYKLGRRRRFANITMPAIFDEYKAARFVVSIGPAFPRLVHERILQGIDTGAAVVAERSPGIMETFADGEEIIGYDLKDGDAAATLAHWMDRPEEAWNIVEAGRRRMKEDNVHAENARRIYDMVMGLRAAGWRRSA